MKNYMYTIKDMQKMSATQLEEVANISIENRDWYPQQPLYIQDKVALLNLLYQKSPEKYTQLMQRIIKLYPAGACNWIAVYCSYGNPYTTFPDFDKIIEQNEAEYDQGLLSTKQVLSASEKHIGKFHLLSVSTLFDYSLAARAIIKKAGTTLSPENKIYYLQQFASIRKSWLNTPHITSIRQLLDIGWTLPEAYMGYLNPAPTCHIDIDPGAIQALVQEHPEEALKLLSTDQFSACYPFGMHPSYKKLAYEKWIECLYRYCEIKDYRFIEEGINHKLNKIKELCASILEEKDNPEISRIRFERKMDTAGLLNKDQLPQNIPDKKTEKIRSKILLKLFISGIPVDENQLVKQSFSQIKTNDKELQENELTGNIVKRYEGHVVRQGSLVSGATKWDLEYPDTQTLVSYHLTDPIHRLGAQLCFDLIWRGNEYADEEVCLRDMYFYRLPTSGKAYEQIVPESAILHPDEVPAHFRSTALAIFDKITKLK